MIKSIELKFFFLFHKLTFDEVISDLFRLNNECLESSLSWHIFNQINPGSEGSRWLLQQHYNNVASGQIKYNNNDNRDGVVCGKRRDRDGVSECQIQVESS